MVRALPAGTLCAERGFQMHRGTSYVRAMELHGKNNRLIMEAWSTCTYIGKDDLVLVYRSITTVGYPCLSRLVTNL